MREDIISIIIIGIYTLSMPAVIRYLGKHISQKWLAYVAAVVIGIIYFTILSTILSLLGYKLIS
ncbi:MAG: hypothetical protein K2M11_06400 [Paramuribaculum sp.]|nr:hypothetical protein [Paramuribaculum sp.]